MKFSRTRAIFTAALLLALVSVSLADTVRTGKKEENGKLVFWLSNDQIKCSVFFEGKTLEKDRLEAQLEWISNFGTQPFAIDTDADFTLDLMWTGWRAPQKVNNAENTVMLVKHDFQLEQYDFQRHSKGGEELNLYFKGRNNSLELKITYKLEQEAFYARRKVVVRDSESRGHFLQWVWPRRGFISGNMSVLKNGGFGQPLAMGYKQGGTFFGLEYPTSENSLKSLGNGWMEIRCGQEIGKRIGNSWIESEWVVEGLSPNSHVKLWFWKYLDRIRVAPVKPYLLYNSWYDVRAPEIVKSPAHVMNEKNLLRIIKSFRKEMVEKRRLKLDAFVLDDGWDVYKSDWLLSKEQFPRGLAPLNSALKKIGTDLGMWFGPIGGYSNRKWRTGWMRAHGYEVVRDQLCLAGEKYRKLFENRVLDFVRNHGVGYYKWDGIQFSCSEPDHGHPVGIYSRRAVMESVIDLCRSVRAENPNIFLNITSGTWLSPWWVKYANMIWMQGGDYGYADVPSISRRDRAITYRDFVLFEDFGKNDFWFPISNLMTHGIIKGHLQKLGGEAEPLDKFTDNALFYFARGVSMWELYISPDLLTDGEWDALAKSIRWAKDRFEVLRSTEMIGGDPGERAAYGYAHFTGKRGIVAARNPFIESQTLKIALSPSLGLDTEASSLVVERVYPTRWISPQMYEAGSNLEIPLQGYETAIYEIYPVEEASEPLLAGVTHEVTRARENSYVVKVYDAGKDAHLLNPEKVSALKHAGKTVKPHEFSIPVRHLGELVSNGSVQLSSQKQHPEIDITFDLLKPTKEATLAVLLEPSGKSLDNVEPEVTAFVNGKEVRAKVEKQEGRWGWYMIDVRPGKHTSQIIIKATQKNQNWTGKVSVWLVCSLKPEGMEIFIDLAQKFAHRRPMPPRSLPAGQMRRNVKLGEVEIPARPISQ